MNIGLQAKAAQLIDRDDLKAQVTGPLSIRSNASGGIISGRLDLDSGSFKLGSATAAARLPRLNVREINRPRRRTARAAAAGPLAARSVGAARTIG